MKKAPSFLDVQLAFLYAKFSAFFIMLAFEFVAMMFGFIIDFPILTLLIAAAVTGVTYFQSFATLGANAAQSHSPRVSAMRLILLSLPAHALFLIYHLLAIAVNVSISGSGILALAKLLSGVGMAGGSFSLLLGDDANVAMFMAMWYISYAVHVVFYIAASCVGYRYGFMKRERERAALLAGDSEFMQKEAEAHATPLAKKVMFIPFVNLLPFLPWCFRYVLRTERKLRRFFVRLIPIVLLLLATRGLRVLFYKLTEIMWLNLLFAFVLFYLFGIAVSYIIWRDEKKLGSQKI